MAIGIESVRRAHPAPCRHYRVTFVDDDTGERRTLVVHERNLRRETVQTIDDEFLLKLLTFFVSNKQADLAQLQGRNVVNDVAGSRGTLRTLLRDTVT